MNENYRCYCKKTSCHHKQALSIPSFNWKNSTGIGASSMRRRKMSGVAPHWPLEKHEQAVCTMQHKGINNKAILEVL